MTGIMPIDVLSNERAPFYDEPGFSSEPCPVPGIILYDAFAEKRREVRGWF